MPDNEKILSYLIRSSYDATGTDAARQSISLASRAFDAFTRTVRAVPIAEASERFQKLGVSLETAFEPLVTVTPKLSAAAAGFSKALGEQADAVAAYRQQHETLVQKLEQLKGMYQAGIIDRKAYRDASAVFETMLTQMDKVSVADLARERQLKKLADLQMRLSQAQKDGGSVAERTAEAMQSQMAALGMLGNKARLTDKEVVQLARNLQDLGAEAPYAAAKNIADQFERAKKMNISDVVSEATAGLGKQTGLVATFERRFSRFLKQSGNDLRDKVFNKDTIKTAALFGPGGLALKLTGFLAEKASSLVGRIFGSKERQLRGGPQAAPAGGAGGGGLFGASLERLVGAGGFLSRMGGIFKSVLAPMKAALGLFEIFAPAIQAVTYALEPLIIPLQDMLIDVALALQPFVHQLIPMIMQLADELLPVLTGALKDLVPPIMELVRAVLPPLVTMLKMAIGWFAKVAGTLIHVLAPVIGKVVEWIGWLADKVVGVLSWLGTTLLDIPVIGWALRKLGFGEGAPAAPQPGMAATQEGAVGAAEQGIGATYRGGDVRAMTVDEAGGRAAFEGFSRPRQTYEPYTYAEPGGAIMSPEDKRKVEAISQALGTKPTSVAMKPEEQQRPVVKAISELGQLLLNQLPARIGRETKTTTLAAFGAATA